MKENVILIDFKNKNNWNFESTLNSLGDSWRTICKVSNFKVKNMFSKLHQYLIYFIFPFSIFLKRKKFNKIIAWQQFYGLIFAYYCKIFNVKKINKLVVMTFIYKDKKSFVGKIYYNWIKKIIYSKYIDKLVVFSQNEVYYYSSIFPDCKEKFVYMDLGVNIPYEDISSVKGTYFVSAGKSNRDYNFLINSFKFINEELKIISYTAPESKSNNVKILKDCFGYDYYKLLAEAFCVIISLDNDNISSGQLVLIHAMQLKKPIICTRNNSISEYVVDGYNGFIIDKNIDFLNEAIEKLKNESLYNKISKQSYDMFLNKFSMEKMAKNVNEIFNL